MRTESPQWQVFTVPMSKSIQKTSKAFIALYLGEHIRCSEFMTNMFKQNLNISSAAMLQEMNFIAALVDILIARDDQEEGKKLPKSRWRPNFGSKKKFGSRHDVTSGFRDVANCAGSILKVNVKVTRNGGCDVRSTTRPL